MGDMFVGGLSVKKFVFQSRLYKSICISYVP